VLLELALNKLVAVGKNEKMEVLYKGTSGNSPIVVG